MPPVPREMHSGTMADDSRMIVFGGRGPEQQVTTGHAEPLVLWGAHRIGLCACLGYHFYTLTLPASAGAVRCQLV